MGGGGSGGGWPRFADEVAVEARASKDAKSAGAVEVVVVLWSVDAAAGCGVCMFGGRPGRIDVLFTQAWLCA